MENSLAIERRLDCCAPARHRQALAFRAAGHIARFAKRNEV
jgi:hypothetical protein